MTDAERLRALAARYDMTSTARYEADAEAFYRETGFMSPGKDVPMAMGGQDEARRRAAYKQWVEARNAQQQTDILRGAAAIEENARLLELLHDVFLNPYVDVTLGGNPNVTRALMKRVSATLTPTQEATRG
jgi:hypothetical protein